MKVFEALGIGGEKTSECLGVAKSAQEAWKIIHAFKVENQDRLKVESYDRIIQLGSGKLVIIDFGDYSRFLLVESDGSEDDLKALEDFFHPSKAEKSGQKNG